MGVNRGQTPIDPDAASGRSRAGGGVSERLDLARLYRAEHGRVLATVARVVGDLARAEEFVQEAWLRALEHWPRAGQPGAPGAWLVTTARRLAIDAWRRDALARREATLARREATLARREAALAPPERRAAGGLDAQLDAALAPELLRDDPLRLMFTCCHPLLRREVQVALTLHTLGGLGVQEIAQAFLADERAIAQRLVRAKRTLRARRVPYRVPTAYELPDRLPAVLDVLYLVFNEGYAANAGDALVRAELCEEALRLARLVARALPSAEALALVALFELQASRLAARSDMQGRALTLEEQDRTRWDRRRIAAGLAQLAAARRAPRPGAFLLQAEIAACHARAQSFEVTPWHRIVAHYDALLALTESPVVALNRAIAVGFRDGADAGLAALAALRFDPRLRRYAWLPAARADLLRRARRWREAAEEYARAEPLMRNAAERAFLVERRAECLREAACER
jgi:RNA polymerase sigma factor (sigma-70 family)